LAGFFIFDIETVINQELFEKTATKKQKERYTDPEDDYFLPVVFHTPVAISILFTNNCDEPVILPNGKPYFFESTVSREPAKITERFFELFYRAIKRSFEENIITETTRNNAPIHHPILVSHNGLRFDLPVLYMWGIKNFDNLSKLAREGLGDYLNNRDSFENNRPNYTKRFSRFQLDTVELFPYSSLKSICYFYDIQVKTEMEGDGVEGFFRDGKMEEIGRYCAEDVLSLSRVVNMILKAKGEGELHLPDSHVNDCELRVV